MNTPSPTSLALFSKILHLSQLPAAALVVKNSVIYKGPLNIATVSGRFFVGNSDSFEAHEILSFHLEPDLLTIEIK